MPSPREPGQLWWRVVFTLAAAYNIGFGAWAIFFPQAYFDWFGLGIPTNAWIWSCLGMVIGVYGLGYAHVAWKPQRGDVLVALGLIGKMLGPIGWLWAVARAEIPPRTFTIILFNDLIWWFPFAAYLLRRSRYRRVVIAMMTVAFHVVASAALLVVKGGTEAESNLQRRMQFVQDAAPLWTLCWFLWSIASLGLLAFFVAWAAHLRKGGARLLWLAIGCALCGIGLFFDLASETIMIVKLTDSMVAIDEFQHWSERASLFGAGIGNGLYCVGGIVMTVISWRIGFQRGTLTTLAAAVWLCGLALSAAVFCDQFHLMVALGAVLMATFIPWATITGLSFRDSKAI